MLWQVIRSIASSNLLAVPLYLVFGLIIRYSTNFVRHHTRYRPMLYWPPSTCPQNFKHTHMAYGFWWHTNVYLLMFICIFQKHFVCNSAMLQEKWFLLLKENHSFKLFCITVLLCVRVLELEMWGGWGVGTDIARAREGSTPSLLMLSILTSWQNTNTNTITNVNTTMNTNATSFSHFRSIVGSVLMGKWLKKGKKHTTFQNGHFWGMLCV